MMNNRRTSEFVKTQQNVGLYACKNRQSVIYESLKTSQNVIFVATGSAFAQFGRYVEKPYLLWMKDRETRGGIDFLPIYMAPCLAEM